MKEKNRFSSLLKHLMTIANLKNYTLAKELQYDESYISKWVTGSLMPTEKTHEKVLQDISRSIVRSLDSDGWATLLSDYQLTDRDELEQAIFDNLEAEYRYVMDLKESTGSEVAPKTTFYPELTLAQFLSKMHHPVLRNVKDQQVISAMDILSLDRSYQLALSMLNNPKNVSSRNYPGVSFSMLINLDSPSRDIVYDVTFLLNLLSALADINFNLYTCPQAIGKLIFSVRDAYSISGMIIDENHCISVTTSEDTKNCNGIYDRLNSLCGQESLVLRKTSMKSMIRDRSYVQSIFARNHRTIIGFFCEHMLPKELFEELLLEYCVLEPEASAEDLRQANTLCQNMIKEMGGKLLIFENALLEFAVTGEVDFFNRKFHLTPEQRLEYLKHSQVILSNNRMQVGILKGGSISDIQHIPAPNLFLSDTMCHLRLKRTSTTNQIGIVNKVQVCDMFRTFFDAVWEDPRFSVIKDPANIEDFLHYIMQMVRVQITP
ncbi:MAG: hypothetical protein IIW56_10645 [Oscillospiraceae bacterium]|nr:hypothetical protein [Oscillospiraceae bacterium]